jgi:formylglycine-generating enzyme required for sulfatase activity
VIVRVHANRIFRLADMAGLVREWMQAHALDIMLARYDGALFAITHPANEAGR